MDKITTLGRPRRMLRQRRFLTATGRNIEAQRLLADRNSQNYWQERIKTMGAGFEILNDMDLPGHHRK